MSRWFNLLRFPFFLKSKNSIQKPPYPIRGIRIHDDPIAVLSEHVDACRKNVAKTTSQVVVSWEKYIDI